MRRWIAALLALQLFCGVSLFAYGQGSAGLADVAPAQAVACLMDNAPDEVQGALSDPDAQHERLAESPDLPEGLHPALAPTALGRDWNGLAPFEDPALASTTLDGLQRPPRA